MAPCVRPKLRSSSTGGKMVLVDIGRTLSDFLTTPKSSDSPSSSDVSWGALARAFGVGVVCATAMGLAGYAEVRSARNFSMGQVVLHERPGVGFSALYAAYKANPLDRSPRRELGLAASVVEQHGAISPALADRLHEIALTAGDRAPLTLFARVEYLITSGRWVDRVDEIEGHLETLQKSASLQPMTWVIEAAFAMKLTNYERAHHALDFALSLDGTPAEMETVARLKQAIGE